MSQATMKFAHDTSSVSCTCGWSAESMGGDESSRSSIATLTDQHVRDRHNIDELRDEGDAWRKLTNPGYWGTNGDDQ